VPEKHVIGEEEEEVQTDVEENAEDEVQIPEPSLGTPGGPTPPREV